MIYLNIFSFLLALGGSGTMAYLNHLHSSLIDSVLGVLMNIVFVMAAFMAGLFITLERTTHHE